MSKISNVVNVEFRRNPIARLWGKLVAWNQKRIAIRQLSAMPDRLLQDIGIERYEISDAVNRPGTHRTLAANRPENRDVYDFVRRAA